MDVVQTANKVYLRNFGLFGAFFVSFTFVLTAFFWEGMYVWF